MPPEEENKHELFRTLKVKRWRSRLVYDSLRCFTRMEPATRRSSPGTAPRRWTSSALSVVALAHKSAATSPAVPAKPDRGAGRFWSRRSDTPCN